MAWGDPIDTNAGLALAKCQSTYVLVESGNNESVEVIGGYNDGCHGRKLHLQKHRKRPIGCGSGGVPALSANIQIPPNQDLAFSHPVLERRRFYHHCSYRIVRKSFNFPTISFSQIMQKMEVTVTWAQMEQTGPMVKLEWTVGSSTAIRTLMMVVPEVPIRVGSRVQLMEAMALHKSVPMSPQVDGGTLSADKINLKDRWTWCNGRYGRLGFM